MISKEMKSFSIGTENYRFDSASFNTYFKKHAAQKEIKISSLEEEIANKLYVTTSTIHNWRFGSNGPGTLELIQNLANALSISDYMNLLKKNVEANKMEEYATLKIESIKRIYDAVIDFLEDFYNTDGFTGTLWYKFQRNGSSNPEEDIFDYAENKIRAVSLVLQKEYFYLHDTKVYSELCEYVHNNLWETFDGKLGYAYRFEAIADGNPTTEDDYNKALKRINEIIEQYI